MTTNDLSASEGAQDAFRLEHTQTLLNRIKLPDGLDLSLEDVSEVQAALNRIGTENRSIEKLTSLLSTTVERLVSQERSDDSLEDIIDDLTKADSNESRAKKRVNDDGDDTTENNKPSSSEDSPDAEEATPLVYANKIIPKVREGNWQDFVSRYSGDDGDFAVEALVSGHMLEYEKDDWEQLVRQSLSGSTSKQRMRLFRRRVLNEGDGSTWIQQVRINSRIVMLLLGNMSEKPLDDQPTTFVRPFRYLIHYQDRMVKELNDMKSSLSEKASDETTSSKMSIDNAKATGETDASGKENSASREGKQQGEAKGPSLDDMTITQDLIDEVQCYVDFVEDKLMPPFRMFQGQADLADTKVRFDDLCYLFKVGDLIYVPQTSARIGSSHHQFLRRVQSIHTPIPSEKPFDPREKVEESCQCPVCMASIRKRRWYVTCHYLDYDGESYRAVEDTHFIDVYKGTKEVTELPFYPIRFAKDHQTKIQEGQTDGLKFVELIKRRYGFYNGWTLIKTPSGAAIEDYAGSAVRNPEHVESEIIVDFQEAFSANPSWMPGFLEVDKVQVSRSTFTDPISLRVWTDKTRSAVHRTYTTTVMDEDGIERIELNKLLETDKFLMSQKDKMPVPEGEDLALLPRRLFAYALWERKFAMIDLRNVRLSAEEDLLSSEGKKGDLSKQDAFDQLATDPRNKDLIKALVHWHFEKKELEKRGVEIGTQDLIYGKGKGIVILLHGPPGVGKTATAEAVAQRWERPLFPITCGDLGFTPEKVQKELQEMFRLAHLWNCILLLDEADVFVTQREHNDLQRNALVSVFLRTLEYYHGILFLTTNRVGELDEAIKSRVHLHLHYDLLNEEQTLRVFKSNIERLRKLEERSARDQSYRKLHVLEKDIMDFAKDHYRSTNQNNGLGRWNGRQIRNAFLIAASLAHYEGEAANATAIDDGGSEESQDVIQKQLRSQHFKDVEKATSLYDEFRNVTRMATDDELALRRMERADGFVSAHQSQSSYHLATERRNSAAVYGNGRAQAMQPSSQARQQQQFGHMSSTHPPPNPVAVASHQEDRFKPTGFGFGAQGGVSLEQGMHRSSSQQSRIVAGIPNDDPRWNPSLPGQGYKSGNAGGSLYDAPPVASYANRGEYGGQSSDVYLK